MKIGRVWAAAIAQIGLVGHAEVNHRNSVLASCFDDGSNDADHARRVRDVDARDVEHPALAGERILHIHNDDGRFLEIDREWVLALRPVWA